MYGSSRSVNLNNKKSVQQKDFIDIRKVAVCSILDFFKVEAHALPIGRVQADHQKMRALKGSIVLVTGGSRGIGKATCEKFAASGCTVVGTSRTPEKIKNKPENYTLMKLDVRSDESVKSCIQEIIEKFGRIDILVNNAGIGQYGRLIHAKTEDWINVFQTNLFGVHRVTQAAYPYMHSESSRIITLGSLEGETGYPYQALYALSKRALQTWNDSFDFEQRKSGGPRFTLLEPAWVDTDFGVSADIVHTEQNSDDPYARLAPKLFIQYLKQYGIDPKIVADTIFTIAALDHPKLRYYVGLQGRMLMGYSLEGLLSMVYTQPPEQILAFMDALSDIAMQLHKSKI